MVTALFVIAIVFLVTVGLASLTTCYAITDENTGSTLLLTTLMLAVGLGSSLATLSIIQFFTK